MGKLTESVDMVQQKKFVSNNVTNPNLKEGETPSSIYIDPKVAKLVEKLKNDFGSDDFIPLLAGFDSETPNKLDQKDIKIFDNLDRSKQDLTEDINIFKNAMTMYKANHDSSVNFTDLLYFTSQYNDINNGNLNDGLFIEHTPKTENIFKNAKIKQQKNKLEINLNDAESADDYSTYTYDSNLQSITTKIKHYKNGINFTVHASEKFQSEMLEDDGIKPIDGKNTYVVNGKEYNYIPKKDYFINKANKKKWNSVRKLSSGRL